MFSTRMNINLLWLEYLEFIIGNHDISFSYLGTLDNLNSITWHFSSLTIMIYVTLTHTPAVLVSFSIISNYHLINCLLLFFFLTIVVATFIQSFQILLCYIFLYFIYDWWYFKPIYSYSIFWSLHILELILLLQL